MFCNHKYEKVEKGYQYCKKCGKAISVPCNHKWKRIFATEKKNSYSRRIEFFLVASECERCREIKLFCEIF